MSFFYRFSKKPSSFVTLPFYPGPVSIPADIRQIFAQDFGPPRMGEEFLHTYRSAAKNMQKILYTQNEIVMPTGEGMLGLWGALKSVLKIGDKVVTIGTGVFGDGFAEMAKSLGCQVEHLSFPHDVTITANHLNIIEETLRRVQPLALIAVHCETPSGTLNPLQPLGGLKKQHGVPLFIVDAVSSIGGTPVNADACHVDIVLGGSQKCLACPADMSILAISDVAWHQMQTVQYVGYDALLPFRQASQNVQKFPYTPNWHGITALEKSSSNILAEGLFAVFVRHQNVAVECQKGLAQLGISLFPTPEAISSPTVTAAYVPEGFTSSQWQKQLAQQGLIVGKGLGIIQEKIFRLGHMGPQANLDNLKKALKIIRKTISGK